ncbi:MAG TPA: bifunctional 4-hydroxy-2-oxoglutarate aldolase/2-dehydro-3-deoxy-phosphogluconate aldolase, partial [Candidatus Dormibacteraeota bacterium]|nr:bifunctional 4-hydroxy-2-oxoglutarate aldolase/2-dehydro-3-deoxy-phosphogluconate aldolase [Candidatus Dormibacteraeota bacterium]
SMSARFDRCLFKQLPIVGILRFFKRAEIEKLVPATLQGGLCNLEITMNSEGAEDSIRLACALAAGRANVGAGTVTSVEAMERALAAGASFIVTPVVIPEVIQACVKRNVPVMPGALTPTEIFTAWQLGATIVKVFPADQLGPAHLKAIKAPFPEIPLMPTGGITVETLPAFMQAGADAFGAGGPLFDPKQAAAGNWDWFRLQAARFAQAYAATASRGNG